MRRWLTCGLIVSALLSYGAVSAAESNPYKPDNEVSERDNYGIKKICIGDQWYLVTYNGGVPNGITAKLKAGQPEQCGSSERDPAAGDGTAEQRVKKLFPTASVARLENGTFELSGVPKMFSVGLTEAMVWDNADRMLKRD